MARSYATVGQMTTYAMDRTVSSPDLETVRDHDSRIELTLRHMLEFVLMAPRSRDAFLRTIARTEHTTGSIVAAPRLRKDSPGLFAEMLPTTSETDDAARLGIALRVGGAFPSAQVQRLRSTLGSSPHHLLITIVRASDRTAQQELTDRAGRDEEALPAVVTATWSRLARRMPKADPGHAHLWETIGEIGEDAGSPVVQYPLNAKRLLTKSSTAQELRSHLDVLHQASRTLLGTSPRFSTRRGQTAAHLQAGVSRARTGLELGEVDRGALVHFLRTGDEPAPLGIGRLTTDDEHAAADERLNAIRRRTGWRSEGEAPPTADELIGTAASPEVEGARLLLWALWNPMLLRERGFDLAPARRQPALSATTLGMRLTQRGDETGTLYRIWVGGERRWSALIPRVTREATADHSEVTYAIAPRKNQSTADFVWEVHRALRSLTIAPTG